MERQTIKPESEEHWLELRKHDITSTDVAALFGCSPYNTDFEIWHRKAGKLADSFVETERTKWGNRLQDAIAQGVCKDNGWTLARRMDEYIRLPDLRLGSSFDWEIIDKHENAALLEIKNVDRLIFKDHWLKDEDGDYEAPPHIEFQVQHQMLVAGYDRAYIAVLVGGNEIVLIKREADEEIQSKIIEKGSGFWASQESGQAPEPDFKEDGSAIGQLYGYAEPGKVIAVEDHPRLDSVVAHYLEAAAAVKTAKKVQDASKAEIMTLIGDAEKILGQGYTISAGVVGPKPIEAHTRKGYRNFRVTKKKVKGA